MKTQALRRGRVSREVYRQRLEICANCPSGHVKLKNGKPNTCGPMLQSFLAAGKGQPCGCLLETKAWDAAERCPGEHWPT